MKPNPMRLFTLMIVCWSLGWLALSGCGPTGGGLAIKIHYTPRQTPTGLRTANPPDPGEAPPGITGYRLCVLVGDEIEKCQEYDVEEHRQGAKMTGLKPGGNRTVTFQGYSEPDQWEVRWCGKLPGVKISGDETTRVSMFISACSDFTGIRNEMVRPRVFHTATRLSDGRVVLIGGFANLQTCPEPQAESCSILSATGSIDVYRPRQGAFDTNLTGMSLHHARGLHTASLLPDDRVLVFGGAEKAIWRYKFPDGPQPVLAVDTDHDSGQAGRTAEIINLKDRTVTELDLGDTDARALHAAVTLPNGDVLLIGGIDPADNRPLGSVARFVSSSQQLTTLDTQLVTPRHAAAVAQPTSGRFLLWGGNDTPDGTAGTFAEILIAQGAGEPYGRTPSFVTSAYAHLGDPTHYAAAVSFGDDRVLVCGGMLVDPQYASEVAILDSFRVLDMTDGSEAFVGADDAANQRMLYRRAFHSASPVSISPSEQKILVAGGMADRAAFDQFTPTDEAEFFSPDALAFETGTLIMRQSRAGHSVVELLDGTLLFSGGFTFSNSALTVSASAEVYNPSSTSLRQD